MHLNESKVMPNSSIDSDADENRVTIIPPCWTSAELSARPFFWPNAAPDCWLAMVRLCMGCAWFVHGLCIVILADLAVALFHSRRMHY